MSHHATHVDQKSFEDGPAWLKVLPKRDAPAFRAFRQFNHFLRENDEHFAQFCSVKARVSRDKVSYFPSESMVDQLARMVIEERLLHIKELIESLEFFQRVRRRISRQFVADLCCGHGLVGMLFALFERSVERVYLLDMEHPRSSLRIEEAINSRWPWVSPKIIRLTRSVKGAEEDLPMGAGVIAVHACGARTDWSIEVAKQLGGPLAVMPCCYAHQSYQGPDTLKKHLGVNLCVDLQRTNVLHDQGYQVDWLELPPVITPKNRIIAASPPRSFRVDPSLREERT